MQKRIHGKITLQDIADRLHLSRTTISLALRDHSRISKQTKQQVHRIARRLGYQPDQVARALVTGHSNLIAVVAPDTGDHYYAEVFRGIEEAAHIAGYHVLLANTSYEPLEEEARIRDLLHLKIAGIIAAPAFADEKAALSPFWRNLKRNKFPLVLVNRELDPPPFHQVTIDNAGGIRIAMEQLAKLGHRRVAYITGMPEVIPIQQRFQAFRRLRPKFGFDLAPDLIEKSEHSLRGGYESCARLWDRLARKPTAILCFSDAPSIGVMRFLGERNIQVPEQVSVLGFDGTDTSEFSRISLSTVGTPMYEMGKQAFATLEEAVANPSKPIRTIVLPVNLILRESVASPNLRPAS